MTPGALAVWMALAATPAAAPADSFETYYAAGRYADADRVARDGVLAAERAPGRDSLALAGALERWVRAGGRLSRTGPQEIGRARRVLAIRERAYGPTDPRIVPSVDLLAGVLYFGGQYDEARATAERTLRLLEPLGAGADSIRARSLTVLANVESEIGDRDVAVRRLEEIRDLRIRLNGPDAVETGQALHNLAAGYRGAGRVLDALRTYRQALELRERVLPADHPDIAWTLNNLANVYFDLGDLNEALRLHRRALEIRERRYGPEHSQVALSLMNLGNTLDRMGDHAAALPMQERALAMYERAHGPWHRNVAQALNNVALTRMNLGDLAGARPLFERSIAIRDSLLGPGGAEAARSRTRLGFLLLRIDDPAAAERVLREAWDAECRTQGPEHPLVQHTPIALAVACLRLGRDAEALDLGLDAERVTVRHLRLTAQGLDEAQALIYAGTRSSGMDVALTVAAASPRDSLRVARTWDAFARSRYVVLDEMAWRRRWAAASEDSSVRRLVQRMSSARDRMARLALQASPDDSVTAASIVAAAAEAHQAELAVAERSLAFRGELAGAGARFADLAAARPPGAALVSFAWYGRLPRGTERDTVGSLLAFVQPAGPLAPRVVPLGPASDAESAIAEWLAAAHRPPDPLRRSRDERAIETLGRRLRERIWDPVARELGGAERVVVVLEGALHHVPIAALPDGRGRVLAESGPLVHLIATERDLLSTAEASAPGEGLLAIGGPAFGAAPSGKRPSGRAPKDPCAVLTGGSFDPLPGAAGEAAEVARTWDAARAAGDAERARVLTGEAATERALRELAPRRRALHVAAHGFFLPERCPILPHADSTLLLAQRHPLLRGGLALAGANRRGEAASADGDGILTAEEVAGLDLAALDWAVLSACETGLGLTDLNEGVLGLRRAFRVAGARAMVMSLWRVEDVATAEWMRALYRARFARGMDAASAARDATREVLRARRAEKRSTHAYYWGGFVAESGPAASAAGGGGGAGP